MCVAAEPILPSPHFLARPVGHEVRTMTYIQAVAEDESPMKDPEGNPMCIPAPREAGKSSEIICENEMSARDKMTLDQKKHY